MVKPLRTLFFSALCLSMSACLNAAPDAPPWLQGQARIAASLPDFPASELELSLYRIGPADRAAELVERRSLALAAHAKGQEARLPFSLGKATQYKIQKGDSLYLVAKRFNVEMQHLKRWNPRTGQALKPGQMLVVSGPR